MSQEHTNELSLYPNPARSTVTITAADDIFLAEIMDMNYSTLLQAIRKKPGSKTIYLDISRYKQGVYNGRITKGCRSGQQKADRNPVNFQGNFNPMPVQNDQIMAQDSIYHECLNLAAH